MAISTGTGLALGAAGSLLGGMGGKNKGEAPAQSGFAALPKAVQDAWLNTYLPKAMETAQLPFQSVPMQRAVNPANDPFASQGLWDLQQYSDSIGGMFSPMVPDGMGGAGAGAGAGQGATAMSGNDSRAQYLANEYLSALGGGNPRDNQANAAFTAVNKQVESDPGNLMKLGQSLMAQKYNPGTGSRGVDINTLLAALGGR